MKIYTNRQLFDLIDAIVHLERVGFRWLVDFGYENAVEKWHDYQIDSKDPLQDLGGSAYLHLRVE